VEALAPLLESRAVAKVMHDCREDSAALFHQHGVRLQAVFDTQAAQVSLDSRASEMPRQASMQELLGRYLRVEEPPELAEVKALMLQDPQLWTRRPLPGLLVRYALHGVDQLLPLRTAILDAAAPAGLVGPGGASGDTAGALLNEMVHASQRAADYCLLNREFPSAASMAKIGTRLWAYVAARTDVGIYFKLNAGRVGLASTAAAIDRFNDVRLGDIVLCCVSGVSINGSYLYLDRYDHDWDYFDHQLRPTGEREVGAFARELRYSPSLFAPPDDVDPLIVRGLPGGETGAGLDDWESTYDDLGHSAALDDL